ncbi:hypothetical protein Tco_0164313 [Tanacetum coccineum]
MKLFLRPPLEHIEDNIDGLGEMEHRREREAHVARKCSYKEFMSCQPFNFKGSEGAVRLIRCSILVEILLPNLIGIEDAYRLPGLNSRAFVKVDTVLELKVKKMEDKFLPSDYSEEKMMEVFIGGLPQSIEGNVTASKLQTLEEAINIAQRLMDQRYYANQCQRTTNNNAEEEPHVEG